VELLVVIGIIALLVGILLPTLNRARESANAVACASNMRSAATAMIIYTNDHDGWLAGPHTSGARWNVTPGTEAIGDGSASTDDPNEAMQNFDWMSPTLGPVLGDLPVNDVERLQRLFDLDLECPSVSQVYTALTNTAGISYQPGDIRYGSYAAVIQFHAFPRLDLGADGVFGTGDRVGISDSSDPGSYRRAELYATYGPKITKVGPNSSKVYLIEGPRTVDVTGTAPDIVSSGITLDNARYRRQGGAFMARGMYRNDGSQPHYLLTDGTAQVGDGNWTGGITPVGETLGWRHAGATMNLAFFDGHVEKRPVADSIQPELFFPTNTLIDRPDKTFAADGDLPYRVE
jgi:prepilin-type processing-associated H-X9-DG protein